MIKIGVITAQHSIPEIKKIEPLVEEGCSITYLPYTRLDEIIDLYEQNHIFFDGILFSGQLGYNLLLNKIEKFKTPTYFLDITEGDFYKQLFTISITHKNLNFSRVGMDVIAPENNFLDLKNVITENEFPKYIEIEYHENLYHSALSKYLSLWKNGEIDFVLTRISNIVNSLIDFGIPTIFIFPSKESILEQVKFIINELQINKLQEHQDAIGVITLRQQTPTFDDELHLIMLHKALLEYNAIHKIFSVIQQKNNCFEIITTIAELKSITKDNTKPDLLGALLKALPFEVNIGWGIGNTFYEARKNAQIANNHAALTETPCSFVINANGEVFGPISEDNEIKIENANNPQLQKISDNTGITIMQLNKILALVNKLEEPVLSADDVSYQLNISTRQANRILNKLMDAEVAFVSHKKQEKLKGRPKKLYTFDFSVK